MISPNDISEHKLAKEYQANKNNKKHAFPKARFIQKFKMFLYECFCNENRHKCFSHTIQTSATIL